MPGVADQARRAIRSRRARPRPPRPSHRFTRRATRGRKGQLNLRLVSSSTAYARMRTRTTSVLKPLVTNAWQNRGCLQIRLRLAASSLAAQTKTAATLATKSAIFSATMPATSPATNCHCAPPHPSPRRRTLRHEVPIACRAPAAVSTAGPHPPATSAISPAKNRQRFRQRLRQQFRQLRQPHPLDSHKQVRYQSLTPKSRQKRQCSSRPYSSRRDTTADGSGTASVSPSRRCRYASRNGSMAPSSTSRARPSRCPVRGSRTYCVRARW